MAQHAASLQHELEMIAGELHLRIEHDAPALLRTRTVRADNLAHAAQDESQDQNSRMLWRRCAAAALAQLQSDQRVLQQLPQPANSEHAAAPDIGTCDRHLADAESIASSESLESVAEDLEELQALALNRLQEQDDAIAACCEPALTSEGDAAVAMAAASAAAAVAAGSSDAQLVAAAGSGGDAQAAHAAVRSGDAQVVAAAANAGDAQASAFADLPLWGQEATANDPMPDQSSYTLVVALSQCWTQPWPLEEVLIKVSVGSWPQLLTAEIMRDYKDGVWFSTESMAAHSIMLQVRSRLAPPIVLIELLSFTGLPGYLPFWCFQDCYLPEHPSSFSL